MVDCHKEAMVAEENKALVRRFVEEFWNEGNLAAADELVAPECLAGGEEFGPDRLKQFFTVVRTALPDLRFTIEDIFAEGDQVAFRFVERGTHKGTWLGIPPTGNTISVSGTAIYRIANGQIVQQWSHNDLGTAIRQIGARIVPGDD
jgi:steroid delta-isomerase-like uncharacterized protein